MVQDSIANSRPAEVECLSDADAIRLAQKGCSDGFEHLYMSHGRRVYSLCLRMVGNTTEAEDLTQDVFLQLFRKIHTFRGESAFSTWLHRLTINLVLMQLRKKRQPEISLEATIEPNAEYSTLAIEPCEPDLRLNGVVDRIHLRKAIDQLPGGYKEIFILYDVQGYEHKEIAGLLECSVGNSKSQLFKARQRLRALLQEAFPGRGRVTEALARCTLEPRGRDFGMEPSEA